jgi:hypothetical protein
VTKLIAFATVSAVLVGALIPQEEAQATDSVPILFDSDSFIQHEVFKPIDYVDNALFDLLPEIPEYIPPPPVIDPPVVQSRQRAVVTSAGQPTDEQWYRLRMCESTDNPRAVSPQGWYRGLYQFDLRTWEGVGGVGDPIEASRDEQDLRARLLYEARGANPWPVCGRFLY